MNGHECKVFGASNVELVTKTRTEHLTESDKVKAKSPKTPLQSFLGIAEIEEKQALPETNNVIGLAFLPSYLIKTFYNVQVMFTKFALCCRKSTVTQEILAILALKNILMIKIYKGGTSVVQRK